MSYDWIFEKTPVPELVSVGHSQTGESTAQLAKACGVDFEEGVSDHRRLWMCRVSQIAGFGVPADPNRFRSWIRWGRALLPEIERPSFGDVLLASEEIGDIGIYIGEDDEAFHVLTCPDTPLITRMSRADFWTARRPAYDEKPETVHPVLLKEDGSFLQDVLPPHEETEEGEAEDDILQS